MARTVKKLGKVEGEQMYEFTTPRSPDKQVIPISYIDDRIAKLEKRETLLVAELDDFRAMKAEAERAS